MCSQPPLFAYPNKSLCQTNLSFLSHLQGGIWSLPAEFLGCYHSRQKRTEKKTWAKHGSQEDQMRKSLQGVVSESQGQYGKLGAHNTGTN